MIRGAAGDETCDACINEIAGTAAGVVVHGTTDVDGAAEPQTLFTCEGARKLDTSS